MSDYAIDQHSCNPFEEYLKKQMLQWDREAEELTATLGMPREARYDLVAVIHGQVDAPELVSNPLPEKAPPNELRPVRFEEILFPVCDGLNKLEGHKTRPQQPSHALSALAPLARPQEDYDPSPDETLVQYDQYIVALVRQRALHSTNFARPGQFELEVDEMAQRARIKFWQALARRHIEYPKAYLKKIVYNEFIDLLRKRRQPLPLLKGEDGEWHLGNTEGQQELTANASEGKVVLSESWVVADPADKFEESENLAELMTSTADALAKLAPRQREAMICELYEKIDTTLQLIEALRKNSVEVETVEWPENEADKVLLKASLSPARHRMAKYLNFDVRAHREKV